GLPAPYLFPEGLRRLLELNRTSAVDYIETLSIWLDEGLNDSRTAKRLFICRNSFLSRQKRLLAALEIDINDPDARFYLSLCLRLLNATAVRQ
ncbi:MAG: helix-turn-helix domain-containing protein, partial [Oscillospiraceae bacterium]|nr:helix-turn-helix domain-containing protein [Oscillospiraceae bacterium]